MKTVVLSNIFLWLIFFFKDSLINRKLKRTLKIEISNIIYNICIIYVYIQYVYGMFWVFLSATTEYCKNSLLYIIYIIFCI